MEELHGKHPGEYWSKIARRWEWAARAEAGDQAQRERLRAMDEDRRFDARERRLQMIDRLLDTVFNVLLRADMEALASDEVRAGLPTFCMLFKDLLSAQRADLGLPTATKAGVESVRFTADDLLAAQRELDEFKL